MKSVFIFFILLMISNLSFSAAGYSAVQKATLEAQNWTDFQQAMNQLQAQDHKRGTSFIVSGTLVTVGSLLSIPVATDAATKFVYGIASTAGIAAITYGIANIYYGNSYNSFYNSLKDSSLSDSQKSELVKSFMFHEKLRMERVRQMQMIAHFFAAAMNTYSASVEKDANAKTFFSVLAGLNLALGISYSF